MATIILPVTGIKQPDTNPARIDRGSNRDKLLFDASTDQSGEWQFRMPTDYDSGLTVKIQFAMADTQSGTNKVEFEASVMAVTPEDSADVDTNSFDTVNTGIKTLDADQTAGYLKELSISLTNVDSLSAEDLLVLKLTRDADDATNDTATGDVEVVAVSLEYTTS